MIQSPTKHKFSVQDVILMEESGILGPEKRIELLDGELIDMCPILPPHAICVNNLNRLLIQNTLNLDFIVSVQNPMQIGSNTLLEPDLVIAKNRFGLMKDEYIKPKDVELLIEVSDSSYNYDKTKKLEVYAEGAIKEYWIVNLQDKQVEVHKSPKGKNYQFQRAFSEKFETPFGFAINTQEILPSS